MALENTDLLVVQRADDGELCKVTVQDLVGQAGGGGGGDLQSVTDAGNTTTNGATFGGNVNVGNTWDTGDGVQAFPGGGLYVRQDGSGSGNNLLTLLNGGNAAANQVARFNGDGSAFFQGTTGIGGLASAPQILLSDNGFSSFKRADTFNSNTDFTVGIAAGFGSFEFVDAFGISARADDAADNIGSFISYDGTAFFSNKLGVGGGTDANVNIELDGSDGSAEFGGNVNAPQFVSSGRFLSTQTGTGEVFNANSNKIRMFSNGDADFQGSVSVAGSVNLEILRIVESGTTYPRIVGTADGTFYSESAAGIYPWQLKPDGSSTFAGNIQSGSGTFTGPGSVLQSNGKLYLESFAGDTATAFQVTNPSDYNEPAVNINHDGSAEFGGQVDCNLGLEAYIPTNNLLSFSQEWFDDRNGTRGRAATMGVAGQFWVRTSLGVGGTSANDYAAAINSDGSATFANYIVCKDNGIFAQSTDPNHGVFVGKLGSSGVIADDYKIALKGDGSATFGGGSFTVDENGYGYFDYSVYGGTKAIPVNGGFSVAVGLAGYSRADTLSTQAAVLGQNYLDGGRVWCGANSASVVTSEIFTDGSATFEGEITTAGINIQGSASQSAIETDGSDLVFSTLDGGGSLAERLRITGHPDDGSSFFSDSVEIGGVSAAPNIELNTSGSITTKGDFTMDGIFQSQPYSYFTDTNGCQAASGQFIAQHQLSQTGSYLTCYKYNGAGASDIKIILNSNGGAYFGETVQIGGTNPSSSTGVTNDPAIQLKASDGSAFFQGTAGIGGLSSAPNIELNADYGSVNAAYLNASDGYGSKSTLIQGQSADKTVFKVEAENGTQTGAAGSVVIGENAEIVLNASDGSATFGGATIGYANDTGTQIYSSQGIATVTASGSEGITIHQSGVATAGVTLLANGSGTFGGDVAAANFNSTSDISLKDNIVSVDNPLQLLEELEGVRFDWKSTGKPTLGVIAQNVETVLPELVNANEEGVKSVNYNGFIAVLIEAVKSQQKQIDELKQLLSEVKN